MISILIPTIRPQNIPDLSRAIKDNAGIPDDQYEIVWEYDRERIGCPKMLRRMAAATTGEVIAFLGDDTIPCKDFLEKSVKEKGPHHGKQRPYHVFQRIEGIRYP